MFERLSESLRAQAVTPKDSHHMAKSTHQISRETSGEPPQKAQFP